MSFWENQRVMVTGGAGFLGRHVVAGLEERGAAEFFVPRSSEYDLRRQAAVKDALSDARPTMVIHLAAVVGGIGANRAHPAEFFYDNLMMGAQLMHESWQSGVSQVRGHRHRLRLPQVYAYPLQRREPLGRLSGRDQRPLWPGQKDAPGAERGLPAAVCVQFDLPAARESLRPGRQLRPGELPRHPGSDPQVFGGRERGDEEIVAWGDGSPTREFLYVSDAAEGIVLAAERYNRSDPVNLGSGKEISIKNLLEKIAGLTGFEGRIVWDTSKPNGQPRRALDTSRAWTEFGFRAETDFDEGLRRTVDWYQQSLAQEREGEAG
jgi:GDP-L-fucose synthase